MLDEDWYGKEGAIIMTKMEWWSEILRDYPDKSAGELIRQGKEIVKLPMPELFNIALDCDRRDIVKLLLEEEIPVLKERTELISRAFVEAAKLGNDLRLNKLIDLALPPRRAAFKSDLPPDEERQAWVSAVAQYSIDALRVAIQYGHLQAFNALLEWVVKSSDKAEWPTLILKQMDSHEADWPGYKEFTKSEQVQVALLEASLLAVKISRRSYHTPFVEAILGEKWDIVQRLLELVPSKRLLAALGWSDYGLVESMIHAGNLGALKQLVTFFPDFPPLIIREKDLYRRFFSAAVEGGNLPLAQQLLSWVEDGQQISEMISAQNYRIFHEMLSRNNLDMAWQLFNWAGEEQRSEMISAQNYRFFNTAFRIENLDMAWQLFNWAGEEQKAEMMLRSDYKFFCRLAGEGDLSGVKRLLNWAKDKQKIPDMISALNFGAFCMAAEGGYLSVLEELWKWAPGQHNAMIAAEEYGAFYAAAVKGHPDVVNWLLLYPSMLAHAEMHQNEYAQYVNPFIADQLSTLHARSQSYALEHPGSDFDLSDLDEIKRGFYMARNLIRRTHPASAETPALLAELNFLLNIPAVRALAHQRVEGGPENELLRLAISTGNQVAATVLLAIPEVQRLAAQHNYYHTEAQGGLDLRALAQDRESSMQALSEGEKKRLEKAEVHYKPLMEREGIEKLFEDFRKQLVARYTKNPASVMQRDKEIPLPVTWKDFQDLPLTETERAEALKAYYQHIDHTVLRYLSKPNAWMAPNASYVYVNPDRREERWATFEEYKGLIVLLWLAAQDEIMPPQEASVEDRLTLFVAELALIGRAHNWDQTRTRPGHPTPEQYDDLEGDKPSCYSGMKKRLFQSVLDHPLLKVMDIEQDLREFVRTQLQAQIKSMTREQKEKLLRVWDAIINQESYSSENLELLKSLSISEKKQEIFMEELREKYKDQFDEASENKIKKAFIPEAEHHFMQALKLLYCWQDLIMLASSTSPLRDLCDGPETETETETEVDTDTDTDTDTNTDTGRTSTGPRRSRKPPAH